jgi:hypothetical protein
MKEMEIYEVQNDGRETRKGRKGRKHVSVNATYKSGELFPHVAGKDAAFDQTVHRGCSMKKLVSRYNLLCIVRSEQEKMFRVRAGDQQGTTRLYSQFCTSKHKTKCTSVPLQHQYPAKRA